LASAELLPAWPPHGGGKHEDGAYALANARAGCGAGRARIHESVFVLNWFRGYWQLPLHPNSQELYSFVTHRGIYTSTRVPMGAIDAVACCQGVVEEIFGDLIGDGIQAWLDDVLGYGEHEESLSELLDKVLGRCENYGLKLHAKTCLFFSTEAKWCGRIISGQEANSIRKHQKSSIDSIPPRLRFCGCRKSCSLCKRCTGAVSTEMQRLGGTPISP